MNEDARGITPPNVTAMTVEPHGPGYIVIIEQGNGDLIKTLELTHHERALLGTLLEGSMLRHIEFVDLSRWPDQK